MARKSILFLLTCFFLILSESLMAGAMESGEFLVICYHNIPAKTQPNDSYGVPQNVFIEQLEYLRTHGYHPISITEILKASKGKQELPHNAVLLTFDDAYISYYEFVVPVLRKFGYPSVLAVVGSWIDNPPEDIPEPLMNWEQIKEVAQSELVEIASHTFNLHKGIPYNPQGNVGSAVSVRAFDPILKKYETEAEYEQRITDDFIQQRNLLKEKLGIHPWAVVWPYGRYNQISVSVARREGLRLCLSLDDGVANVNRLQNINRIMVGNNPLDNFIRAVKKPKPEKPLIRAIQVDLDLVYDPKSGERTYQNLGKLIERLVAMGVNTVFLQAFSDPTGSGNVKSVFFPNRVLPVEMDIFSHAVHHMIIRDMKVYAWVPTLSIILPDRALNKSLRVHENENGQIRYSHSWYKRLTPFSPKVRNAAGIMYEDLAAHSQIHGILFQDDAYLTDKEDFHPIALRNYRDFFGKEISPHEFEKDSKLAMKWTRYKTEVLIEFTKALQQRVRKYRPNAMFARNLYATVLTDPESEKWFAQNYELFLRHYDYVAVMAYPQMEKIKRPSSWLQGLVNTTRGFPHGLEKTVFKVQTYDWSQETWVKEGILLHEIRTIFSAGGKHIAYYPDNFLVGKPAIDKMKLEMSTRTYHLIP
jgi:biofilm PGA synthesis lipoprotein PgaB